MSYPYLSDFINHLLGTQWQFPLATFGSFVALAIVVATSLAKKEVVRFEELGLLPKTTTFHNNSVPTHQIVADLAVISAIAGIIGARIFHVMEYPAEFLENPMGMIFSVGGLSIYGGLVFGVIAGAIFLKKHSIPVIPMLDALAPSMMLGYGIGRIGCQISGDGDWGITANMALKPDFIPNWLWAQTYENNIIGEIIQSPGVYPIPIYETLTAFFIFLVLLSIRKLEYSKGLIFSVYMLLSGFARLLIEKIRINNEYHIFGSDITQAEIISVVLILLGLMGVIKTTRLRYMPKIVFSIAVLGALTACTKL